MQIIIALRQVQRRHIDSAIVHTVQLTHIEETANIKVTLGFTAKKTLTYKNIHLLTSSKHRFKSIAQIVIYIYLL